MNQAKFMNPSVDLVTATFGAGPLLIELAKKSVTLIALAIV
jgi:hypothetical protein